MLNYVKKWYHCFNSQITLHNFNKVGFLFYMCEGLHSQISFFSMQISFKQMHCGSPPFLSPFMLLFPFWPQKGTTYLNMTYYVVFKFGCGLYLEKLPDTGKILLCSLCLPTSSKRLFLASTLSPFRVWVMLDLCLFCILKGVLWR